jgi:hypothetical protein
MKKILLLLAAITFCTSLTLPAFGWGKRHRYKPPKPASYGKVHGKQPKLKGVKKSKKVKISKRRPRNQTVLYAGQ